MLTDDYRERGGDRRSSAEMKWTPPSLRRRGVRQENRID
ncbi:protein of unknown function [Burkholderia multivorans]